MESAIGMTSMLIVLLRFLNRTQSEKHILWMFQSPDHPYEVAIVCGSVQLVWLGKTQQSYQQQAKSLPCEPPSILQTGNLVDSQMQ